MLTKLFQTAASLGKVMLLSRPVTRRAKRQPGRSIVIMGNGPSLRQTIDNRRDWLAAHDLMAVNFAANTPEFAELRPQHYILADGHFMAAPGTDPNVDRLWQALAAVSWPMTLWVAAKNASKARRLLGDNHNVTVKTFNLTPLEGYEALVHPLIDAGAGMPRPRNVMIPAIITAIRQGYGTVLLAGADHTWTRTLSVDDDNFVVSVQPHFYKDNEEEHTRVRAAYAGLHLHDVLGSMTIAFRSYWHVRRYADSRGVKVLNCTPGSMIDAFDRQPAT